MTYQVEVPAEEPQEAPQKPEKTSVSVRGTLIDWHQSEARAFRTMSKLCEGTRPTLAAKAELHEQTAKKLKQMALRLAALERKLRVSKGRTGMRPDGLSIEVDGLPFNFSIATPEEAAAIALEAVKRAIRNREG